MNRKISRYGWQPDLPDQRDFLYKALPSLLKKIPSKIDLRKNCPSVYAKSGKLNMPKKGEKVVGGHAVLAVGYVDSTQRFIIRNSWAQLGGKKDILPCLMII
jgi:hypothetical protein